MYPQLDDFFDVRTTDDLTEVRFTVAKLDDSNVKAVGRQMYDLVERSRPARLRLDFARVEYVSSTFLGKLLGLHRRVQAAGGQLTLENLRPPVYEVFAITGLTYFLHVRKQDPA